MIKSATVDEDIMQETIRLQQKTAIRDKSCLLLQRTLLPRCMKLTRLDSVIDQPPRDTLFVLGDVSVSTGTDKIGYEL